ncbi:MAG TPA: flagellar filament capping protein FliD [Gallionella sp.]|nr:flagellar filament capping protein FliD [Gallionella sp.]
MATTSATSSGALDVNGIVSQLMTIERQPITKLNTQEASYQAKLSAYGSVKGALASFQTALQGLTSANKFQSLTATPSDTTVFSASATGSAVAGSYSLEVSTLAQAQKLVAAGQTSTTAAIGSGAATMVTFDFGTISGGTFDKATGLYTGASYLSNGSGTKSITIDSSNNSLQGIRDAINSAKVGVTASIINDGSGTPYRLALSSDNKGVSNSLKISVSGDAAVSGLLAHDPAATQNLSESVTAQNANLKVNGVAVSKTTNTISDVIQGVTLNLSKATTSAATLTVARDTAGVSSSISAFVKAYNDLNTTLKGLSAYDAANKKGAILQGDSTVRSLQAQLRSMLTTPVAGTSGAITTLSNIGVSFQKDGSLALDQVKLDKAIASNFSDIANLFSSVGKSSDSLVAYGASTAATKPGSYAVNVSSLATQGGATGDLNLNAPPYTIASGTSINVTLDGIIASVALTPGASYSAAQLASMVQSAINGTSAFSSVGASVSATITAGGFMSITSNRYGSTSNVSLSSNAGTPVSAFMGTVTSGTAGTDVAGTINGMAATGSGQKLTSSTGDSTGLAVTISGGATGARGTVNYSQGYAYSLDKWATSILGTDGILASRTNGLDKTIKDIGNRRAELETRMVAIEKRYRAQYTSLDAMLSRMSQTSTYLSQQLARL